MTRLKKELIKKSSSNTTERIRRIKDQKKVVNSKSNIKISEFHVKRLLESVENDPNDLEEENNNGEKSSVTEKITSIMADSEAKEVQAEPQNNSEEQEQETPQPTEAPQPTETPQKSESEVPEEDMEDFDLVGLSPESQKNKTTNVMVATLLEIPGISWN